AAEKALEDGAEVYLTYRRTIAEAPAGEYPIISLIRRGIRWIELVQPRRIVSVGGFARGVEFVRVRLGELDESGRPRPIAIEGSEFTIETDLVIAAVGEIPTPPFTKFVGIETDGGGRIAVDKSYRTGIEKIFAAGDVVSGPTFIGRAFGCGLRTARSLDIYLATRRFR
ncbi:MAG: FAD-dependent oxidoreductase, partial [Ignisphaera sp.]